MIDDARLLADPRAEFVERSKLYRARGLSTDTSLLPNFAVEEALKALQRSGVLARKVRRVAVIGPGLDFIDKAEGYDFYPQQTIQPFAIVDSLLRLDLAEAQDVRVTAFDLSPRVNVHLAALHQRAMGGHPYVVQLPLDATETWSRDFLAYWTAWGDQIGARAAAAPAPPNAGPLKLRAVSVRPDIAKNVSSIDLDIVLQRLEMVPEDKFDLIVGTNVFVYYSEFQQALALTNLKTMIRPGGVLLSNNALAEPPAPRLRRRYDRDLFEA